MRPVLIILALVASVISVPTGPRNSCPAECPDTNNFSYQTGKRYVYQYEAATSTALLVTLNDHADVHITATAHVDVTSPCDYTLTLTDVVLDGSSHTEQFAAAVTKSPLRFSFQDGHVEAVCSEVSEPAWVLNFKRGVLSTFQNSMTHPGHEDLRETDVSGTCLTHYRSRVEGSVTIIDKVKDLSSCTHRPDLAAYIASTPYMTDSPMQSLPIFNSTNSCHQTSEAGILKTAECHETHKFQPFSSEEGGAVTTVKTTFTLVSQEQPAAPAPSFDFIRKSLVYEQTTSGSSQTAVEVINQLLADLDQASHGEVRPEVPALFSNLVASLKPLDYPTLSTLYFTDKESHSHKFLVDAMPLVGTAAAVGVMKDIIINGDISQSEADAWFTSLAFQKNPTTYMFTAIVPLLETPSQQAVLGASALVNTYCKLHSNCEADAGVQQVLRAIETQLGSSCGTINEQDKMKVLIALKGLSNAGHWVNANQVLQSCYIEHNEMEVRVAAIEAWRHTPCTYDRSHLLAAFQDETQDSEVRIAAYLAVMTCPTETVINIVKDRLTSEAVNQVGSFIWTHLTNLQESAAPGKQWVREMIGEELLQNKFNTEALKFSRNYESSFFTNELNVGASVDSNIIFSSKSYLPRSAMINLNFDLFGESINLFEVGGRIQGFESYVEQFFGPSGYFPQEMVEEVLRNMNQNKPDGEATTLEQLLNQATDEPQGSYYLRMYGKELHYNHFHGLDGLLPTSNPIEVLMELARQGNIDYTKSYQLIDSEYSIPTVSGLPVTLSAKGTATLALRMNGNFNANSLTNFNIEGHFHPSAAVQMDGVMMVDAHVARKGLQISSTLHTSTFVDGKVHINGGKLVDVVINTPKQKVEVIDVNTKFYIVEDDVLVEKDVEAKVHYETCTSDILGGHLCGEIIYTPMTTLTPVFPLSGPFSAQLYLEKTDTHTGYVFHYALTPQEITIMFDTPGSQDDQKWSIALSKAQETFTLYIYTPIKSIHGTAQYSLQNNNKQLKMEVKLDNSEIYSLDAGIESVYDNSINIKPHLVINTRNGPILTVSSSFSGHLREQPTIASQLDIDYVLLDGSSHKFHVTADAKKEVVPDLTTYSSALELTSTQYPILSLSLVHNTKVSPGHVETHGRLARETVAWDLDHSLTYINEGNHKNFEVQGSIKCPTRNIEYISYHKIEVTTNMINMKSHVHLSPVMNYDIDVAVNKVDDQQYKAHVVGIIREDTWEFNGELKNGSVSGRVNGSVACSLTTPNHNLAFKGDIHGDTQQAHTDLALTLNGQVYSIKIDGTRTSIMADIHILRHILLNAYVSASDETNLLHLSAEWDKDNDPTQTMVIDGRLSQMELHATLKLLDWEILARGEMVENGLELVAQWAGDQSVVAKIYYSLEDTKSLSVVIETPFPGWQKQDITVAVSINQNELNARAVANWKNSEQVALTVSGNLQPGLTNNTLNTNILFSSTFNNFERLTFTFYHKMASFNINTIMEAAWNDIKINGAIRIAPTETGLDGSATLTSPFTQEVVVTLHHELVNTQLSTSLEAKYGTQVSTFNLNGHIILDQAHDITLNMKIVTPLQFVSEIEGNLRYNLDGAVLTFVTEGKIGDSKMQLNINGEKTVSGNVTNMTGELRFITPFTNPLTAKVTHNHDGQQFASKLVMLGSLALQAQGHYLSEKNIHFNGQLSSPLVKSSFNLDHTIDEANNNIKSSIELSINEECISASVSGVLDISNSLGNIEIETVSSIGGLDDIKINLDTKKEDNSWISKMTFNKGSIDAIIDHTLTYIDYFNWSNIFIFNNIFQLRSSMDHSDNRYTFAFLTKYDEEFVNIVTDFVPQHSANSRKFDAGAYMTSSFTEHPFKLALHHQDDGTEFNNILNIEYVPGSVIEISSTMKIEASNFHITSTLHTPFWQTMAFKLTLVREPINEISLELMRGSNKTNITVHGNWEDSSKMDCHVTLSSTYLTNQIILEGSYDMSSVEKTVSLAVTAGQTYSITAAFTGEIKNAHWRIMTMLPFPSAHDIIIQGEYNISAMPLTVKAEVDINTKKYVADIVLNPHDIQINMDVEGRQGLLTTNWDFHGTNANMDITFQSPVDIIGDMKIHAMYDIGEEIKMNINVNDGAAEITVLGKLGDILVPEVMLTITTPFDQVKSLQAGAKLNLWDPAKTAHINFHLNDNHYTLDLEIYADGLLKGHVASKITTTIPGWTTFNLKGESDFEAMELKALFLYEKEEVAHKIEGSFTILENSLTGVLITTIPGWQKLTFTGDYSYQNDHFSGNLDLHHGSDAYSGKADIMFGEQPKIVLIINTPYEYARNAEFNYEVVKGDSNSVISASLHYADVVYSAEVTLQYMHKLGLLKLVLNLPIPGYTATELMAKYDLTGDLKMADMDLKMEGNNIHFTATAQINDNNVNLDMTTPFEGYETIKMMGDYTISNDHHSIMATLDKNDEKYDAHFDLSTISKEMSITLITPISAIKKVKVYSKFDILDHGLDSTLQIQRNTEAFSLLLQADFAPLKSAFHVALETPIPGWNELLLDAKYDFQSDKKVAGITFKKNNALKVLNMEAIYNLEGGHVKLQTPVEGYEVLGVEYTLTVDTDNHNMAVNVKAMHNSQEWVFTSRAQHTASSIYFEVKTPFDFMQIMSAAFTYNWDTNRKDATLQFTYNEHNIVLTTALNISATKSELSFQANTPIPNYENVSVVAKYDINNRDALVSTYLNFGQHVYNFIVAGYIDERLAYLKWDLTSPFTGWTDVKFEAKIDLANEDSIIYVSLLRDGNNKVIDVHGKIIGSTIDINLKTPFNNLPDFSFMSALDRTRRSLDLSLANDYGEASLAANFNSVKLQVKTPFERAREILWEISKISEGKYKAEWRRNDNYAVINVERQDTSNAYNVEISSEIQVRELASFAFLSGDIGEEKIVFSSSATFDTVGNMNMHIETPSELYRSVDINLDYNIREKMFIIEAISSSSTFHSLLKVSQSEGLECHLLVPNPEKDTEVIINLGLYFGKVAITSRFNIITNFLYQYDIQTASPITVNTIVQLNDVELFKFDVMANIAEHKVQFGLRLPNLILNYKHIAFSSLTLRFRRLGEIEQLLNIAVTGSGRLPAQGTIEVVLNSSFLQPYFTSIKVHLEIDMTQERKHVTVQVTPNTGDVYELNTDFGITREAGDFDLRIATPDNIMHPWKHITGNFNIHTFEEVHFEFTYGQRAYTLDGKLGVTESDLVMTTGPDQENILFQWKFDTEDNDYLLKMGRESKYAMIKLNVNYQDIGHVVIEGGFKAGPSMENELTFNFNWDMQMDGHFVSNSQLECGDYEGELVFRFTENLDTLSANVMWELKSNVPGITDISAEMDYSFDNQVVLNGKARLEEQEATLDITLNNFHLDHSHNTVEINMPFLPPRFRAVLLTLSHDLRDPTTKSISAVANLVDDELYIRTRWTQSEPLDILSLNTDIKLMYVGDIHIVSKYDFSNINDVAVEVQYVRNTPSQESRNINLKWIGKKMQANYETELTLDSTFHLFSHARFFVGVDLNNGFHLSSELEVNVKKGTFVFYINPDSITAHITTPFQNFESIEAKATYSLTGKKKKVTLIYERGSNKAEMDFSLDIKSNNKGNLIFTLTTPIDLINSLHIEASWKNNNAEVNIKRNNFEYKLNGKINLEVENSSFDVSINIPGWHIIRIAASYDVHDFLAGTQTDNQTLAGLELQFEGNTIIFNMHGFRNEHKFNLEFEGSTSFAILSNYQLTVTYESNDQSYKGDFEIVLNGHNFITSNLYEKRGENGYYMRSMIETTLTPLPALIVGIGHNGDERTVTIGYGEDREITLSIQGKNNFRSGFSGVVDIPNFGYDGVTYDVLYGFQGEDTFSISANINLGHDEQNIEVEFVYDSEGVQARLTSPLTGERSLRFRRSVSTDNFSAEAALNQYSIQLRGGFKDGDFKKGALLEVDIMNHKFLFDFLFQSEGLQYSEGKLIIMTPFPHLENMGGLFTLSTQDRVISGQAEVIFPFFTTSQIKMEINLDLNQKVEGHLTFDIAGEKIIFKTNLAGESLAQGYSGTIEIQTPFSFIPNIILNTSVKIVQWSFIDISLGINDKKVMMGVTLDESTFKTVSDIQIGNFHNKFAVEIMYPSLDNIQGSINLVVGDLTHGISGSLTVLSQRIHGSLKLQSSIIESEHNLAFDISLSSGSYEHIIFDASLTSSESHSLHLEVNMATGVMAIVSVDTPLAPKLSVSLNLQPNRAELVLETPSGQHKVTLHGRMTYRMPADYIVMMDVASPYLSHTYSVAILLNGDVNNMVAKAELQVDDIKHTLEGKTIISDQAGEVSITLETPFRNINKLSLAVSLNLAEQAEMLITASTVDKVNTIHMTFDKATRKFKALATSPYIPTEEVSLEANLIGDMKPNMKLKMALKYGSKTLSGMLNLKLTSSRNIIANLKLATPFRGYKKMNFLVRYRKTDTTFVTVTIDKPIRLNFEIHLTNEADKILADMKLESSVQSFEFLEAKMEIPLDLFAPSVGVEVNLGEASYGAHLRLRTSAPYELGLGYHKNHQQQHGFHIRTDSSFFSIFS